MNEAGSYPKAHEMKAPILLSIPNYKSSLDHECTAYVEMEKRLG